MKKLLLLLLLFTNLTAFSQKEKLYDLIFTSENFKSLTIFGDKVPEQFYILDSTLVIHPQTFYLPGLNLKDPEVIAEIEKEEHHYYHSSYIFSDKQLDTLISDRQKIILSEKTKNVTSKKIRVSGKNYSIAPKNYAGNFLFVVSEPIFSDDRNFAFISVYTKHKIDFEYFKRQGYDPFYHQTFTFRKVNGLWQKVGVKQHLIL